MDPGIDTSRLQSAAAAQAQVREAERRLEEARRDFEIAVRRLYVEGASVRAIAHALGLSHQRIHQLIGAKARSWWQYVTGRVDEPSRGCSFCGEAPGSVAKLVAGPSVHICDMCVAAAMHAFGGDSVRRTEGRFALLPTRSRQRCSFCGKRAAEIPRAAASGHQICGRCAELAQHIITDEARA